MKRVGESYLIVKLAAAGDVLLTTAMARALRAARPAAHIAWMTSSYAAPLLDLNPDLDDVIAIAKTPGIHDVRATADTLQRLRIWRQADPRASVLLAHRSAGLRMMFRAAGFARVLAWGRQVAFDASVHRLDLQAALLRAAGIGDGAPSQMCPRLVLSPSERRGGEAAWAGSRGPRWAIAPGGGANPWAAMPNRRWPAERFALLAAAARRQSVVVRWLGGEAERALLAGLGANPQPSMRATAAIAAAADLVIGNDSLPLVLAQALGVPALGLYGPTNGATIHAPAGSFIQGTAPCSPCYDHNPRGLAYRCPHADCMDSIAVAAVLKRAHAIRAGAPGFAPVEFGVAVRA